jgi:HEAT repeat protein
MARILILILSLAVFSAHAADLEKWVDKMIEKDSASYRKEQITILAKEPDPEYRIKAAEWLSSQRDPESVAALAGALSDKDARVRKAAASSLWDHGEKGIAAKPQLMKALDDPDANVVAYAAGALQAMGLKEAELVAPRKRVVASQEASVSARFLAARNLVGYETPTAIVVPMIAYLERNTQNYTGSVTDKSRTNVELAENALEHLVKKTKDRSLIRPLYEALGKTKNGQIALLKTLGLFEPRPEGWTDVLLGQLDQPQARVRYAALGQLRSVNKEKDVAAWLPRVAQMLQDPDASVRSEALWAMGSAKGLAAPEVDKVVAALSDKDKSVRRSAARALEDIGEANQAIPAAAKAKIDAAARPALTAALEDPDSDVRDAAKSALRNMDKGGGTAVASAAPVAPASAGATGGNEAAGMAVLRTRKVKFEENQFFRALTETDVELVRAFLDAGMSPSASLSELGPPIRVMLFASNACSPNVRPTKAETKEIIKMLLDRGADVNAGDKNKNTAITEAASKGCDREVIRMLIKAGARINVPNGSGLTPFEMGLWGAGDGLDELIAAGYRLPPDKAKMYLDGYKDRPASLAMVKKATKK